MNYYDYIKFDKIDIISIEIVNNKIYHTDEFKPGSIKMEVKVFLKGTKYFIPFLYMFPTVCDIDPYIINVIGSENNWYEFDTFQKIPTLTHYSIFSTPRRLIFKLNELYRKHKWESVKTNE